MAISEFLMWVTVICHPKTAQVKLCNKSIRSVILKRIVQKVVPRVARILGGRRGRRWLCEQNLSRHLRCISAAMFKIRYFVASDERNHGRPEPRRSLQGGRAIAFQFLKPAFWLHPSVGRAPCQRRRQESRRLSL